MCSIDKKLMIRNLQSILPNAGKQQSKLEAQGAHTALRYKMIVTGSGSGSEQAYARANQIVQFSLEMSLVEICDLR